MAPLNAPSGASRAETSVIAPPVVDGSKAQMASPSDAGGAMTPGAGSEGLW